MKNFRIRRRQLGWCQKKDIPLLDDGFVGQMAKKFDSAPNYNISTKGKYIYISK